MSVSVQISADDPAFRADPYSVYHRIRATEPVFKHPLGVWLITRYADAISILHDARFGHAEGRTAEYTEYLMGQNRLSPLEILLSHWMLSKNPPDHTRLRGLVSKAFTPSVVEALRPRVQAMVDELLGGVQAEMDIIADLAYPLPVMVIAELLGVPLEQWEQFKVWSRDLIGVVDIMPDQQRIKRGNAAIEKFLAYFRGLIAERRARPQDDLLSSLVAVEAQGERLTEHELLANCILLFVAGHETTMNLIGNGMLALLRHPDQLQKLYDEPQLIRSAVEELLRYDGPAQFLGYTAREDVLLDGRKIGRGQVVFILPGAVNRDPAQFPDPDNLDISRSDNRHLAFGYGIHFCLGARLARLEAQVAINALVRRKPRLDETSPLDWHALLAVRGLKALPVRFEL